MKWAAHWMKQRRRWECDKVEMTEIPHFESGNGEEDGSDNEVHDDRASMRSTKKDVGTKVDEERRDDSDTAGDTNVPAIAATGTDCERGVQITETKEVPLIDAADTDVHMDPQITSTNDLAENAPFHKLFEVARETEGLSEGKQTYVQLQEKERVDETLDGDRKHDEALTSKNDNVEAGVGKQPFEGYDYDGPNWSVGLTQLEEIGSENKTVIDDEARTPDVRVRCDNTSGIINDEGVIVMSEKPLMAQPATAFDGSGCVENLGFYQEEIARANRERVLAEMEAGKRKLPDREKGIAYVNKSPYFRRGVNMRERGKAWAEVFTNEEYRARAEELLYRSSANVEATRRMFKTLSEKALVMDRIIDCWAEVMNYEEQFESPGSNSVCLWGPE